MEQSRPDPAERRQLMDSLEARYAKGGRRARMTYLRKRYSWLVVVRFARLVKRIIDVVVSVVGLVALAPLFLVVAALIKITDRGPILYVSERIGLHGKPFRFPKFRSMVLNASAKKRELLEQNQHADGVTFKMSDDPRVTWIGRIIRRTSIDELPQLWCVLKGEMSLVGPRPPLPEEVSRYKLRDRRRLDTVPGLTCFWQVEGRGDVPFSQQVNLDLQYIESSSVWTDLKILLKTVPAVVFGKGAY